MKRIIVIATMVLLAVLPVPAAASPGHDHLSWQLTPTGSTARLRGLAVVNRDVVWASGSGGTVLRTVDGGRTWQQVSPPDGVGLRFRDVEAFDADTALVQSIGSGEESRIYRTTDGGAHWTETFRNPDPNAFYDCMAFFDRRHGLALSDPVDGRFRLLSTTDGGRTWKVLPNEGMPAALDGEFAFAHSGQCLTVAGGHDAWIGTGGAAKARVLHSHDRGLTWTVSVTPLASNANAGVFGVAFRDSRHGVAVGGDLLTLTTAVHALALSDDRGRSWTEPRTAPQGFRSGVVFHPRFGWVVLAVGPSGSDVSVDGGRHWRQFDAGSFDTVNCGHGGTCWAVGEQGRAAVLQLDH